MKNLKQDFDRKLGKREDRKIVEVQKLSNVEKQSKLFRQKTERFNS